MHHHAFGLVDHQQMLVLIDDFQRDVLRHGLNGLCVRNFQKDGVARLELQAFGDQLAVAQHMTVGHQRLQSRPGKAGVLAAQKAVDALACRLLLHHKFKLFHGSLLLRGLPVLSVQLFQKN